MIAHTSAQPRLLIIEDQALIALSVEAYLEEVGFEVKTLTSGAQAQTWLKNNTPEFVILDFMLKDGPSTQLAGELHRRSILFIVYSGYQRQRSLPSEFQKVPWLEKPKRREELLEALVALAPKNTPMSALGFWPPTQNWPNWY